MIRTQHLFVALLLSSAASLALARMPRPPEVAAKSYLLIDMSSNQVLAERNADAASDSASLTKLMTAYIAFSALRDRRLSEEQILPVSMRAWQERKGGGSLMFIEPRSKPTVADLLRGMIVNSGNDAAVALAEGVGSSEENFVRMMNEQAQTWGLKNTLFKNVTGLTEPGHLSTARDLSVIASHIINDFPEYYKLYSIRQYHFVGSPISNQNNRNVLLLRDPTVDGMKTGYTEAAGYCLIASAERDSTIGKRRLLSVLLNTTSKKARAAESQSLLNWGFAAFDIFRLFEGGQPVGTPPVWKGKASRASLGAASAVLVTVPQGSKVQTKIEYDDPLVAPLAKGQRVGTLKVSTATGGLIAETPLFLLEEIESAGILERAWDTMRLWVK